MRETPLHCCSECLPGLALHFNLSRQWEPAHLMQSRAQLSPRASQYNMAPFTLYTETHQPGSEMQPPLGSGVAGSTLYNTGMFGERHFDQEHRDKRLFLQRQAGIFALCAGFLRWHLKHPYAVIHRTQFICLWQGRAEWIPAGCEPVVSGSLNRADLRPTHCLSNWCIPP